MTGGIEEDDNSVELLVCGKIIKLDLPVAAVYEQIWRKVAPPPLSSSDCRKSQRTVLYRWRPVPEEELGDCVEDRALSSERVRAGEMPIAIRTRYGTRIRCPGKDTWPEQKGSATASGGWRGPKRKSERNVAAMWYCTPVPDSLTPQGCARSCQRFITEQRNTIGQCSTHLTP